MIHYIPLVGSLTRRRRHPLVSWSYSVSPEDEGWLQPFVGACGLVEPVRLARTRFGLKVVVLHPLRSPVAGGKPRPNIKLRRAASKSWVIDKQSLALSQFPDTLTDAHGVMTKPAQW